MKERLKKLIHRAEQDAKTAESHDTQIWALAHADAYKKLLKEIEEEEKHKTKE